MARISKAVQEVNDLRTPDSLATFVVEKYVAWRGAHQTWLGESKELRDYLFATDTTTTTNKKLPWKNTTSLPKLTQLRDNLHANYMAALFPSDDWFRWEAGNEEAAVRESAQKIEAYMKDKIRESKFPETVSKAVYDYIDYGNAFGEVTMVKETHTDPDGEVVPLYSGPKLSRMSPYDIVFDVSAPSFEKAGKVVRRLVSFGSLKAAAADDPQTFGWVEAAIAQSTAMRLSLNAYGDSDIDKSQGISNDGLGQLSTYYSSDMVELLEYEGDLYDKETGVVLAGHKIIIMDRKWVVHSEPIKSWLGKTNKEHVGWRDRPDNLLSMGPLDNLVGMQYRIDHLENLKADVFDQIAHPMLKIKGIVEDFEWEPGGRIYMDLDADVQEMRPDATALNANFEIDVLMNNMEELAGAPKQALGIRTPGEKTAFEVQSLENAAGRIFQQKIKKFEEQFIEPLLNQMLEVARRNIGPAETVKVLDDDRATQEFLSITPKDLRQAGKLYPIGARHFAKKAQIIQNLLGFVSSPAYSDPAVATHISGRRIAELFEEYLGLDKFDLVQDNIRVAENQSSQSLATQAQENVVSEIADRATEPLPEEE
jgi:hypothetical protein